MTPEQEGRVIASLIPYGYSAWKQVPGHGLCCLMPMAFTVGIGCDFQADGVPDYRYCYPTLNDALEAYKEWDGVGHPPGPWIKRKGRKGGELRNPNTPPEPWEV